MGKEIRKNTNLNKNTQKIVHFLHRESRRYCSILLCASLIFGSIASKAIAADRRETKGYEFSLTRAALYEALQEAVAEGRTVDSKFEFAGDHQEDYEILLEANGDLYELTPEIKENNNSLKLRIFARLDQEISLDSAYEIDGSEEMIFLLTNYSNQVKKLQSR